MLRTLVMPIAVPPRASCDWRGCAEWPTHRAIQQDEDGAEVGTERFLCVDHAALVAAMAAEVERGRDTP